MRRRSQIFPPFIFGKNYYRTNWDLILALIPAFLAGSLSYGIGPSLLFLTLSVLGAVFAEILFSFALSQNFAIDDGWAISMGVLSALVLPPSSPLYLPVFVGAGAVLLGKIIPGGIGRNVFHPLIISLILAFFLFPGVLSYKWPTLEESGQTVIRAKEWYQLLLLSSGNQALGSYSFLATLIGGIFLALRRSLDLMVSLSYLIASILFLLFSPVPPLSQFVANDILFFGIFVVSLSGTTPLTFLGKIAFGALGGLLSIPFRLTFGPVLGIIFSLPFANATVPFWNFLFLPKARNFLFQFPKPVLGKAFSSLKSLKFFRKPQEEEKQPEQEGEGEPTSSLKAEFREVMENPGEFCSFCTEPLNECKDFLLSSREKGWRFFSVSDESGIQGGAILGKVENGPFPIRGVDYWVLSCLKVKEEQRGKGWGGELLNLTVKAVEDSSGICAFSHESLIPPEFLNRMGFEEAGQREGWRLFLKSFKGATLNFSEPEDEEGRSEIEGNAVLEIVLPPYCSLLIKNYRETLESLIPHLEKVVLKEHFLASMEEFRKFPIWGVYLNGKLLCSGLIEREKTKELILKALQQSSPF